MFKIFKSKIHPTIKFISENLNQDHLANNRFDPYNYLIGKNNKCPRPFLDEGGIAGGRTLIKRIFLLGKFKIQVQAIYFMHSIEIDSIIEVALSTKDEGIILNNQEYKLLKKTTLKLLKAESENFIKANREKLST